MMASILTREVMAYILLVRKVMVREVMAYILLMRDATYIHTDMAVAG